MLEQFRHAQLPWEVKPDTIRLIEILPGSGDGEIVCSLSEVSLSETPDYQALSYCWGNADVQESIIVRDAEGADFSLSIRANLFTALRQIRDPKHSQRVWAGAICINQSDPKERSRQVLLMRQIYGGAEDIKVWLRLESENTWKASSLIREFVAAKNAQAAKKDTRFYYEMGVTGQAEYGLPYPLDSSFTAFSELLEREWFIRVWII
jgi:hypothetical protein